MTPAQITQLRGSLVLKNVSGGVLNLTTYDSTSLAIDEELDILDADTPAAIKAGDYPTAKNMVGQAGVGHGSDVHNLRAGAAHRLRRPRNSGRREA